MKAIKLLAICLIITITSNLTVFADSSTFANNFATSDTFKVKTMDGTYKGIYDGISYKDYVARLMIPHTRDLITYESLSNGNPKSITNTFKAIGSKFYRNDKLVIDLTTRKGLASSAKNDTKLDANASLYITDLTSCTTSTGGRSIIIASIMLIPSSTSDTIGEPYDYYVQYDANANTVTNLFINPRAPVNITKAQHDLDPSALYEYTENQMFPRSLVSDMGNGTVYALYQAVDLLAMNQDDFIKGLETKTPDYSDGDRLEITQILPSVYGITSMTMRAMDSTGLLAIKDGTVPAGNIFKPDKHYIFFNQTDPYKDPRAFLIADIGTPDSTISSAEYITSTPDDFTGFWQYRDKIMQLAGMHPDGSPFIR